MPKYTVKIVRGLCIGAGTCVAVAPRSFRLDEENKAIIIDGWEAEGPETILTAAQVCPTEAIYVYDESGSQVWPPSK